MLRNLILATLLAIYLFVNRYRVVASKATRTKRCLFLVFRYNFEEITITSLFCLAESSAVLRKYSTCTVIFWNFNNFSN